jgi:hypothetical protein
MKSRWCPAAARVVVIFVTAATAPALAQLPIRVGSEFQVDSYTPSKPSYVDMGCRR